MWGCIINFGKVLDYNNIGFSTLSFTLILAARFRKKKRTINLLLIIELGIWLIKYIYYKGGYATGLTGQYPLDIVVLYDFIAIFIRLMNLENSNRSLKFKTNWILAISILLISIKIFFFSIPHELFWETKRIQKKTEKSKSLLIGNWSGTVEFDSIYLDTIAKYHLDTINEDLKNFFEPGANSILIDSTHKYAFKDMIINVLDTISISIENDMTISLKSSCYKMHFNYYNWGDLIQNDTIYYGDFKIWTLNNDSLIITISKGFGNSFKYKLIRK